MLNMSQPTACPTEIVLPDGRRCTVLGPAVDVGPGRAKMYPCTVYSEEGPFCPAGGKGDDILNAWPGATNMVMQFTGEPNPCPTLRWDR